jgi:pyruvate,water dikinase
MATSVLFLNEITDRHAVGGKARGLARLLAAGFEVPEGFVAGPEATVEEIAGAYRRLGAGRAAVRSSAEEEDSDQFSYAGQFETFLGVEGEEALLRAVEACRASGAGARAASYRGDGAAGRMCVVVQRMLDPEYAGVAFAEGDGAAWVEGVRGLGDQLVSGRAGPAPLPEDLRGRVEALAREVAGRLGGAQDIEWASEGGRVWLLQARPVTAPLSAPLPERFRLWTAANLQEALPRPLTPLSEEAAWHNIGETFRVSFRFSGFQEPDGPTLKLVKGMFYMSYSSMASVMAVVPGFRVENLLRMFGDSPDLARVVAYRPVRRLPFLLRLPAILARHVLWMASVERRLRRAREAVLALEEEVQTALAEGASDARLLAFLRSWRARIYPALETMSMATGFANGLLSTMMQVVARKAPDAPGAEVGALIRGGEMESLEPSRQLSALADWLRANPGRPDDDPEVQRRLSRFLDACGFRCENEAELAQPRWRERPGEVLRLAREMALSASLKENLTAEDVEKNSFEFRVLGSGLQLETRNSELGTLRFLRFMVRSARAWQRRREAARATLVRTPWSLRQLLFEVGRRLRDRGVLRGPEDIFYLLWGEIEALLSGDSTGRAGEGIAGRVERRRARYLRMLGWPPPSRLLAELPDGRLVPFVPDPGSGDTLRGFGASPGRVTARARVLSGVEQGGELKPGEVLVARTTDIAWTTLFLTASAVVTEIGAPTSHAAIVARELGLPAVVNVDGVTERVRTGDLLFVDGWAGVVRKIRET